jgi:hypothetical protein
VPHGQWLRVVVTALLVLVVFVGLMEMRLAVRGFRPTWTDSDAAWAAERARADKLGDRALVLIGASRMLLDVDLDVLRRGTGLEPVQLAIDGSSFVPVLEDLAEDPEIRGTVLVAYQDNVIASRDGERTAHDFVSGWQRRSRTGSIPDFAMSEAVLTNWLRAYLRSYADGARPITSLTTRILAPHPTPQYLITLRDRSWMADYSKVDMPAFYYGRVQRTLGESVPIAPGMKWADVDAEIRRRIEDISVADASAVRERSVRIAEMVRRIEARGGRVVFADFPTDGLVRAIDEKRYPREIFWHPFVEIVKAPAVGPAENPALASFKCPDGSHLDFRDRARFTAVVADALHLGAISARGL